MRHIFKEVYSNRESAHRDFNELLDLLNTGYEIVAATNDGVKTTYILKPPKPSRRRKK